VPQVASVRASSVVYFTSVNQAGFGPYFAFLDSPLPLIGPSVCQSFALGKESSSLSRVAIGPFSHPTPNLHLLTDKMAALSTSAFTGKAIVAKVQIRAKASKASVVVKASASDNKSKVSFRD
jgi:hypothetical protein